jgi:hypothetical protein
VLEVGVHAARDTAHCGELMRGDGIGSSDILRARSSGVGESDRSG